MNENTENTEKTAGDNGTAVDELALLKQKADTLGIKYSNNIGIDTLRAKINDKLDGKEEKLDDGANSGTEGKKSLREIHQEIRETQHKEQMALVRCRIYNLNPAKNDLRGEIITVANRFVGTVRKFIPFGEATENGYHIPRILFNELKSRKFQQIRTKTVKGQIKVESRIVPEYQIEELEPLTEEELRELATNQEAARRVNAD